MPTLLRHGYGFFSRYCVERRFIQIQVSGDEFRGSVREPFGKREVLIVAALEHFQELQVVGAGVFDVVRKRFWM